jgi:hypothetical protein
VFELSAGKYFKWAAHDDIILPSFLRRCLEVFDCHEVACPAPAIVYPKSDLIDENEHVIRRDTKVIRATSPWPSKRVFDAVQAMGVANPIFGLMPRDMVARTRLIGSFVASDYVFLLEAAIFGSIVQFDDVLFLRRFHPGASRMANKTKRDVLAWFDPQAKQFATESQRLHLEYFRSISRLPDLDVATRVACHAGLMSGLCGVGIRQARIFLGRYRRKAWDVLMG